MIKSYFKEYIVPQNREFRENKLAKINEMISEKGYVWCENCHKSSGGVFEYHHIIYRSEVPSHKYLNDKINLIMVCRDCHNKFHKYKHQMRAKYIIDRDLVNVFGGSILPLMTKI